MKIGLLVNQDKKSALQTAERITAILSEGGAQILSSRSAPIENTVVYGSAEEVIRDCDIAVTVGGDGTIIHNAKYAALYNKPLLGVNLGRIGFVANIEPDELDELKRLFTGDYHIERRMLLEITKTRGKDSVS